MPKLQFHKDPARKHSPKPIAETQISLPEETYNQRGVTKTSVKKKGRPAKNKIYSTIRIQRLTVHQVNAVQNALDYDTQDDLISALLQKSIASMTTDQKTMFDMYMKTYLSREKSKQIH